MVEGDAILDGAVDSDGNMLSEKELSFLRKDVLEMGLNYINIASYSVAQLQKTKELWDSI